MCATILKLVAVGGKKYIHVRWAGMLGLIFGLDNTNECARFSKLVAVGGKKYTCKMGRDFGPSRWALYLGRTP